VTLATAQSAWGQKAGGILKVYSIDSAPTMSIGAIKWTRLSRSNFVAARLDETENHAQQLGNLGNVGQD
jgi:hypothetical protein